MEQSQVVLSKRQQNAMQKESRIETIAQVLANNPLTFMRFATVKSMVFFRADHLTIKKAEARAFEMLSSNAIVESGRQEQ